MDLWVLGVLLVVNLLRALWGEFQKREELVTRRMVEDFRHHFPGRCMICSMHDFAFGQGWEDHREPRAHDCIERLG